jgi:hypothetical protein
MVAKDSEPSAKPATTDTRRHCPFRVARSPSEVVFFEIAHPLVGTAALMNLPAFQFGGVVG